MTIEEETALRQKVAELERQVHTYKTDQRVTSESAHWHIVRARMVEEANERANGMIAELCDELTRAYAKIAVLDKNEHKNTT